jgi:hypothetical protein
MNQRSFVKILVIQICILLPSVIYGQTKERNWALNGYVKYMQTVSFRDIEGLWMTDNLVHNRLNFNYYPSSWLNAQVSVRNRLFYGNMVQLLPTYATEMDHDFGFVDLSWNYLENQSFFFNTSIDRAFLNFQIEKWDAKIGRQRINWGQTFVWNPNDIFNAYNYFDFDYEEKPGSDAVRLQYYLNYASRLELAAAINNDTSLTAAALYQFNKWQYDVQFLAGVFQNDYLVLGSGWSGSLFKGAFRGEMSYFHPFDQFQDSTGSFVISLGYDYTFRNSLMLQAEYLFSSAISQGVDFNIASFYQQQISARNLSFFRHIVFAMAAYPVTPLINVALSGMYSPTNNFIFVGPSFTFSMSDNFEISLNVQSFLSDIPKEQGGSGAYTFLRGRWSF